MSSVGPSIRIGDRVVVKASSAPLSVTEGSRRTVCTILIEAKPSLDTSSSKAAGVDPTSAPMTEFGYSPASASPAVALLFGDRPSVRHPTAVVVANLNAAMAVLTGLRDHGVRVPEDVSVVALHDAWIADHAWPPLTTVQMPVYEQGRRSLRLLHSALQGAAIADLVISDPQPVLIRRSSVSKI